MNRTSQPGSAKPSQATLTTCGRWPAASSASMNPISSSTWASLAGLSRNTRSKPCSTSGGGGSSRLATRCLAAPGQVRGPRLHPHHRGGVRMGVAQPLHQAEPDPSGRSGHQDHGCLRSLVAATLWPHYGVAGKVLAVRVWDVPWVAWQKQRCGAAGEPAPAGTAARGAWRRWSIVLAGTVLLGSVPAVMAALPVQGSTISAAALRDKHPRLGRRAVPGVRGEHRQLRACRSCPTSRTSAPCWTAPPTSTCGTARPRTGGPRTSPRRARPTPTPTAA